MSEKIRILEINSCGECPHLDARWSEPPWECTEEGLKIRKTDTIHRNCPLLTKDDYLEVNNEKI